MPLKTVHMLDVIFGRRVCPMCLLSACLPLQLLVGSGLCLGAMIGGGLATLLTLAPGI